MNSGNSRNQASVHSMRKQDEEILPCGMRVVLRQVIVVALSLMACVFLSACSPGINTPEEDLKLARKAYTRYDIADAEMYYKRFLRKAPKSPERWEVWNRLLDMSLNIRQEKSTAIAYLEIMLQEFVNDKNRRRGIAIKLAALVYAQHDYNRAVTLWEEIANDQDTPPEDKADAYRNLSHTYLQRLEFSDATEALQACIALDVTNSTKADCLYDMAEAQFYTEDLALAEASLRSLLEIQGISEERTVTTIFLLGDIFEQKNLYAEALAEFESIRARFPNRLVVEERINYLEKKLRRRKSAR